MGNAQPVAGEVTLIRTEQGIAIGPPERNDSSSSSDDDSEHDSSRSISESSNDSSSDDDEEEEEDESNNSSGESSSSSSEEEDEDIPWWYFRLNGDQHAEIVQDMTPETWEELGRHIFRDMSFGNLTITSRALDSDEKVSSFFKGLTGSNTIQKIFLCNNHFGIQGLRSMVPFLQHVKHLSGLDISGNNIGSEGFAVLWRGLHRSPIKHLFCNSCGIASMEIDIYGRKCGPRRLESFGLDSNFIDSDGLREVSKLLHTGGRMAHLSLCDNRIGNEGVAALVDAMKNNTSLQTLEIYHNELITDEGKVLLLKLVIDISSIKATLQSKHTLQRVEVAEPRPYPLERDEYHDRIRDATDINQEYPGNPEVAGREKVIRMQLVSYKRERLADLQGVRRSVFSEIDPLYLPEVLSLIGRRHGHGGTQLFKAVSSTIMTLLHSGARDTEPPRKKRR